MEQRKRLFDFSLTLGDGDVAWDGPIIPETPPMSPPPPTPPMSPPPPLSPPFQHAQEMIDRSDWDTIDPIEQSVPFEPAWINRTIKGIPYNARTHTEDEDGMVTKFNKTRL